jgi:hypothetical protein
VCAGKKNKKREMKNKHGQHRCRINLRGNVGCFSFATSKKTKKQRQWFMSDFKNGAPQTALRSRRIKAGKPEGLIMEIDSLYTINLSLLFLLRHFTPEKWMTEK